MAKSTQKRELLKTPTSTMYAKRNADGTFKEMDNVGRSLAADRRSQAKTTVQPGFGDQGDQKKKR